MKGQKALLLGGLVAALALGSAVGALAQAPDVPGLGDEKPADKPAAAPKATNAVIVTRQDGSKVQGRVHDAGDSITVDTAEGPVSIPKADISAIRAAPVEVAPPPVTPPADKPPADTTPVTPPADKPPADMPPVTPPADKPPADVPPVTPPADKPPADTPPVTPPADKPPADTPPVTPPADKPPADMPPVTPPADKPPADTPPVTPPADKPPADTPPVTTPADKPPADKPPADKPAVVPVPVPADGTQPDALAPADQPSQARAVTRPLYPAEESEFGPVMPDHRGPVELSPYVGWNFISHGIGLNASGMFVFGTRFTLNVGHDDEFGFDLDWKISRPRMKFQSDVRDSAGNRGVATASASETINWFGLSFTYRLRQLRVEYLTPYVSAGAGFMIFDGYDKKVQLNGTTVRLHDGITPAPSINLALGLDYKLDPTFSLRAEIKDEIFFTSFNSRDGSVQVLNSLTLAFGVVIAFD